MDLITLFIIVVVLGALGSVLWWVAIFVGVFKIASIAQRNFEAQLREAEQMLRQAAANPRARRQASIDPQLLNRLLQMNQQYRQLDDLRRQQYEVRVGEIAGMAAQAGIDWKPS
jgi:hypothetical protein